VKRELDAPAPGHRNYRKSAIARGEVITPVIGG
jgi:hypothetical protein